MRLACLFILFLLVGSVYAQDTSAVKQALDRLEQALVEKDSGAIVLQQWVKTKKGWQLWIRQSAKQV